MNENPGGTPNPLNPNPVPPMQPVKPIQPVSPVTPTQPVMSTDSAISTQPAQAVQPTAPVTQATPAAPAASVEPVTTVTVSTEPTQTEPKGSIVEPKKKSKKGLVITLVILLVVAICGAAAAVVFFLNPFGQKDAVSAAISKLLSGEAPKLVAMSGSLNISGDMAPSANINISAAFNGITSENSINARVMVGAESDNNFEFEINEVQVADGDIYVKLSGPSGIIGNTNANMTDADNEQNCTKDESGETNCEHEEELLDTDCSISDCIEYNPSSPISGYLDMLESLEDEWIRVPGSILSNMGESVGLDQSAQCLFKVVGNAKNYSNDFKDLYNKNPFVAYSTKDLKVEKKRDELYRLSLDADKLAGFVNGLAATTFANELSACIPGGEISGEVTAEDLSELVAEMPGIYVEIDSDNNFTRVYFTADNDMTTMTLDLAITYPDKIEVKEPETYSNIEDVLMKIFTTGDFDMSKITDPTNILSPTDMMDPTGILNWF